MKIILMQHRWEISLDHTATLPESKMSSSNAQNNLSSPQPSSSQQSSPSPSSSSVPPNYFKKIPTVHPLVNPDGSFTIFNWKNTKTALTDKPFVGRVPPNTNSPNSLFIDRKFNRIGDQTILDYFRNDLLGIDFFPQHQFLQLTFKDEKSFKQHLSSSPITLNDKLIHLTPPKNFPRSTIVIHLHGLPIMDKSTIEKSIHTALSPYCNIKEIAPIVLANTNFLTTKWDAVVHPIANTKIPVHLNILDSSIALTWANSDQICLQCHSLKHTHKTCPLKQPPKPKPSRTYAQIVSNKQQQSVSNHTPTQVQATPNPNTNTTFDSEQSSLNESIHAPTNTNTNSNMQTDENSQSSVSLTFIDETDQTIANFNDVFFDANSSSTSDSHTNTNNDTTMEIDAQDFQKVKPRRSPRNQN